MKVFLGRDITTDKENDVLDGDELVVAEISDELEQALDENEEERDKLEESISLPLPLQILWGVCAVAVVVCVTMVLNNEGGPSLAELYAMIPWAFYVFGGMVIVGAALTVWQYSRKRSVVESAVFTHAENAADRLMAEAYDALGVPGEAVNVDVLMSDYVVQDGEPVAMVRERSLKGLMIPEEMKTFVADGNLYMADGHQKWAIPLDSITGIRSIDRKMYLPEWNKPEKNNSPAYREYKIREKDDQYYFKSYYALCFVYEQEPYWLYFPPYELPVIRQLTGHDVSA